MADDTRDLKPEVVDAALEEMKLEEQDALDEGRDTVMVNGNHNGEAPTPEDFKRSRSSTPAVKNSASQSPLPTESASQTPKSPVDEQEETISGDITVTVEPGKGPKLLRKSSQKVISRPPTLFNDRPDATEEASRVFQLIKDCIYGSKYMGSSEHDALDCDCHEEWSK